MTPENAFGYGILVGVLAAAVVALIGYAVTQQLAITRYLRERPEERARLRRPLRPSMSEALMAGAFLFVVGFFGFRTSEASFVEDISLAFFIAASFVVLVLIGRHRLRRRTLDGRG